jgi:hypothetical protein
VRFVLGPGLSDPAHAFDPASRGRNGKSVLFKSYDEWLLVRAIAESSSAPTKIMMLEIQIQVRNPITAPKDPYVLLKLPNCAVYQENRQDAASQTTAAKTLPQVSQCRPDHR